MNMKRMNKKVKAIFDRYPDIVAATSSVIKVDVEKVTVKREVDHPQEEEIESDNFREYTNQDGGERHMSQQGQRATGEECIEEGEQNLQRGESAFWCCENELNEPNFATITSEERQTSPTISLPMESPSLELKVTMSVASTTTSESSWTSAGYGEPAGEPSLLPTWTSYDAYNERQADVENVNNYYHELPPMGVFPTYSTERMQPYVNSGFIPESSFVRAAASVMSSTSVRFSRTTVEQWNSSHINFSDQLETPSTSYCQPVSTPHYQHTGFNPEPDLEKTFETRGTQMEETCCKNAVNEALQKFIATNICWCQRTTQRESSQEQNRPKDGIPVELDEESSSVSESRSLLHYLSRHSSRSRRAAPPSSTKTAAQALSGTSIPQKLPSDCLLMVPPDFPTQTAFIPVPLKLFAPISGQLTHDFNQPESLSPTSSSLLPLTNLTPMLSILSCANGSLFSRSLGLSSEQHLQSGSPSPQSTIPATTQPVDETTATSSADVAETFTNLVPEVIQISSSDSSETSDDSLPCESSTISSGDTEENTGNFPGNSSGTLGLSLTMSETKTLQQCTSLNLLGSRSTSPPQEPLSSSSSEVTSTTAALSLSPLAPPDTLSSSLSSNANLLSSPPPKKRTNPPSLFPSVKPPITDEEQSTRIRSSVLNPMDTFTSQPTARIKRVSQKAVETRVTSRITRSATRSAINSCRHFTRSSKKLASKTAKNVKY